MFFEIFLIRSRRLRTTLISRANTPPPPLLQSTTTVVLFLHFHSTAVRGSILGRHVTLFKKRSVPNRSKLPVTFDPSSSSYQYRLRRVKQIIVSIIKKLVRLNAQFSMDYLLSCVHDFFFIIINIMVTVHRPSGNHYHRRRPLTFVGRPVDQIAQTVIEQTNKTAKTVPPIKLQSNKIINNSTDR